MIGQYLPQTNETCYSVLQEFKTLKRKFFRQLNKAKASSWHLLLLPHPRRIFMGSTSLLVTQKEQS
jgi:hypothetical protein